MAKGRIWIAAGCAVLATGCVSLRPEAREIRVTHEEKDVQGCKELGAVQSWVSFSFRDAENQLKNKTAKLKGDTVLVRSTFGDDLGTAYDCSSPQPKKEK
ncbi:MAG: DUF4156 domain-containing protein [Thermoanaerobaculia bacterium]